MREDHQTVPRGGSSVAHAYRARPQRPGTYLNVQVLRAQGLPRREASVSPRHPADSDSDADAGPGPETLRNPYINVRTWPWSRCVAGAVWCMVCGRLKARPAPRGQLSVAARRLRPALTRPDDTAPASSTTRA